MDVRVRSKRRLSMKDWCFWIVLLEKTFESLLDCKEIQPVNPKEISPEYSLEGLTVNLKLKYFSHLMPRADSLGKTEGKRRGEQKLRWLDSISDSMDMNLKNLWEIVVDRGAWCAAVHGIAKSLAELSDWTPPPAIFHCIYAPHLFYLFICPWTVRLLPWDMYVECRKVVERNLFVGQE